MTELNIRLFLLPRCQMWVGVGGGGCGWVWVGVGGCGWVGVGVGVGGCGCVCVSGGD